MTDWDRVERLRSKGRSWEEIAGDPKVGFRAEPGVPSGPSLRVLYNRRRPRRRGSPATAPDIASMKRPRGRWVAWTAGIVALGLVSGLVLYLLIAPPPTVNVVTYCGGEGSASHYHPLLVIDANGVQQHLPYDSSQSGDIGYISDPAYTNPSLYCPSTALGPGIHALHTHDGSGIIHAELPPGVGGTPSLGDFFQIWGQPLTSSSVWTFAGTVTATVLDMDSGVRTAYSNDPAAIPLYQPEAGPYGNAYHIPTGLIFGGTYGSGDSNGVFSGEIIWLNVSSPVGAVAPESTMSTMMMGACSCPLPATCISSGRASSRDGRDSINTVPGEPSAVNTMMFGGGPLGSVSPGGFPHSLGYAVNQRSDPSALSVAIWRVE